MGNSEVGHLNIGAGRVVKGNLLAIAEATADNQILGAPALSALIKRLQQSGGTCHLLGLASLGGVHSHQDYAAAIANMLAKTGVATVIHAFTDGRDTPPQSAAEEIDRLAVALPISVPVATICGRYYAMDRDHRWDRVARAYVAIAEAEGPRFDTAQAVIAESYARNVSDEFV
jgi:2,3-bisphosphoglycerate-independent phosphoglycerate mutase